MALCVLLFVPACGSASSLQAELSSSSNAPTATVSIPATPMVAPVLIPAAEVAAEAVVAEVVRVCLEVSGEEEVAQATEALGSVLARLQRHPDWDAAVGADVVPVVETGCEVPLPVGFIVADMPLVPDPVQTPSPFRIVVVVLDEVEGRAQLGGTDIMLVPYEMLQLDAHTRVESNSALLVLEDSIQNPELARYLTLAMGLDPQKLAP